MKKIILQKLHRLFTAEKEKTVLLNNTLKSKDMKGTRSAPNAKAEGRGLLAGLVKAVWVITVLVWPILKWVLSIEVFFQLVRMFYHWRTPGVHAGWTFLLHFAVLTALTYFVSVYKPKGV